ncbi:MAG TPA: hypothetical protein VFS01_01125 [Rhizomicrobium sp.]|jgi:hypothetical protein|nr:hypothetical protein [Rhizomicrobium sp.]
MRDAVTLSELRRVVGDIDDARLTEIMDLGPSLAEVEEAALRVHGSVEFTRACEGKVALIIDILTADIEDEP